LPPSTASASLLNGSPQKAAEDLDRQKLRSEIDKLAAEIAKLKDENGPLGQFSSFASAIGGLAGALVALVIWFLGTRVKDAYETNQSNSLSAAKSRQDERLARNAELNRDRHNLKLFGELANDNPRTQVATAIVLLDRLAELRTIVIPSLPVAEPPAKEKTVTKAHLEQQCIRSVLVAVLKKDPSNVRTRRAFFKTVAEGLARDLDGLRMDSSSLPPEAALRSWDFQNAALAGVYWRYVDARGVDFFRADLREAGLRDAHLEGTIFYEADLSDAVLRGADLWKANFQLAKLQGADLRETNIEHSILTDATFDSRTKWPQGFEREKAEEAGARFVTPGVFAVVS
jgi:hypothetical protein